MSRKGKPAYKIVGPDLDLEADVARRAGRPSLTGKSEHSPHVSFRITPELKARAEQTAKEQGTTVSQLAREAFERFLAS